jgi:glycosyltransferase involved in cell wall biosynthesis
MRRLRIAFLSRWYWEENRRTGTVAGGPTQQLAEAVADLGHEVIVLSQSPRAAELTSSQIGTLEVWLSPREKRADFLTAVRDKWAKHTYAHRKVHSDVRDLAAFLEQRGHFDVIWAHAEEPDGLVAAMARREGVRLPPLLVQVQALRYRFEEGRPVFNQGPALRLAFRGADRILANSQLVADAMSAYAHGSLAAEKLRAKVRVVFPNLTDEIGRATAGEVTEPEARRVLFFGALNDKKGALTFLEAVARTAAAKRSAIFVVAGGTTADNPRFDASWEQELDRVRERVPPRQLEILGRVSADEAIRQIQRASVVVLPSLFDEFSRALLETLVLGRPVVTTRTVGAWPLVTAHDCGLVVEPNDPAALARAIDDVLQSGAPYAANARQWGPSLIEEFSPRAIALQMAQHLEEISAPPDPATR